MAKVPADDVPLVTLLSQVLIAYTIEFDNEAERRIRAAIRKRVFLISLAMWANGLRVVPVDGMTVAEFAAANGLSDAGARSRLGALSRWRFVDVEPHATDDRANPPYRDRHVRLTRAGEIAQSAFAELVTAIEERWVLRFGAGDIGRLRRSLEALVAATGLDLPPYLPVARNLYDDSRPLSAPPRTRDRQATAGASPLELPALLSQALYAYTIDFEQESGMLLPLVANVLRVIDRAGVRVRDLPALGGISKEAVAMSLGPLGKRGWVELVADPTTPRTKLARLTPKGARARDAYVAHIAAVDERWKKKFGVATIGELRAALQALLEARDGDAFRMAAGLIPAPGGWRSLKPYATQTAAMLRDPAGALPHYPMILHRGGWPDGS